ncbi:hypothetical protein N0V82_009925 [Gnomoniopsis sp. IMI 355080]|nr:hypothetical protein N0V82_009925 [Gnomoniopsis sp. IMI 355080]
MPSSTPGPGPRGPPSPPNNNANTSTNGTTSYDPMFGGLPTNAFSSPAAWHGGGSTPRPPSSVPAAGSAGAQQQQQQLAHSPGGMSMSGGSTGTGPGEEKDPFLTLLEQLADSEHGVKGPGSEFDFFFAGSAWVSVTKVAHNGTSDFEVLTKKIPAAFPYLQHGAMSSECDEPRESICRHPGIRTQPTMEQDRLSRLEGEK